ncbi:HAD family hydrolase [Bowmanella denitrificans]|uniref:HAD family hydrolase n=1 Tax=Bowmanella denitrificans TaxID=366582 RepID=UPI000C9C458A|nr:beta-phosphoglucomutase family hydrolase [Bowmanella denitrificans]
MLDLSRYQGIIFDMDGTLVDSMPSHMQAWQMTCQAFGYPFDPDYMHSLGGVPTRKTVEILNHKYQLEHDPKQVAEQKRQFWEQLDRLPALIHETVAVLHHYRPTMKIGIGTGAERPHALKLLEQTGLLNNIDALVTASDVVHGKPHPETFLSVARLLNLPPAACVVFEDTDIGRRAAEEAGMDCILVKDGYIQC